MFSIQIQINHRIEFHNPFDTILNRIQSQGLKMIEYSIEEYASIKGITYRTVMFQIQRGLLQSVKRGKRRYIQMSEPAEPEQKVIGIKELILSLSTQIKELKEAYADLNQRLQNLESLNEVNKTNERNKPNGKSRI